MLNFKSITLFFINWLQIISCFFKTRLMSETEKDIEILALRSQLSILQQEIYNHKISKPRFTPAFRQLWVLFSKYLPNWKSHIILVKPETVVGWHKSAFKFYWMLKSKKSGRPKISPQTQPKYLIHDRGSMFISKEFKNFLANTNIKSKKTSYRCPWQNGICERMVGIFRRDLTDYIIPFNEKHLHYLLREYVQRYYNPVRTHQGIGCTTPILSDKPPETMTSETILAAEPILGGLYHSYKKAA